MAESIKKNAVLNIIYKLSSIIFPILVYPYVSRVLLADNIGKLSFFSSLTNYAMLVGSLGISTYGVREIAKVRDDIKQRSIIAKELIILNTIVTAAVLIVLLITVPFVTKFRENWPLLLLSCVQIFIAPFSMEWLYNGLEQYSYITKRAIAFKIISLILIFLCVRHQEDYIIYAIITAFGFVGNYVCNLIHSKKFIDYSVKAQWNIRCHIKGTIILFASILAINIYTNVDILMLGFIDGDRAVGLYDVAVKGKTVLLSSINAVSAVLFPRLSYYLSEGNQELYNKLLRKAISIIMCIALPLAIFFFIEAKDVILVLGGKDYLDAVLCMQILMPILLISGFSNITGQQILLPHGKDIEYMKAVMLGACVDIILNVILMPAFSLYGTAIATLIAEVTQMFAQLIKSKKYLKGNVEFRTICKFIIAATVSSITLLLAKRIFASNAFINLIAYFIIFIATYGAIIVILKVGFIVDTIRQMCVKIKK